jgi:outer membrane protein assembly factor BamA
MRRLGYFLFTLACMMCVLLFSARSSAQISRRLDRCLPYPTLSDEIGDMRTEVRAKTTAQEHARPPARRVVVDDVKFDGPTRLPDSTRERLVAEIKRRSYDADSRWLDDVQDRLVLDAWQDEGFFKALPTARDRTVSSDRTARHVLLTVHVDEGLQYKLGDVRFRSADPAVPLVFSNEQLRKLLQIREGDLFGVDKIREALDAIRDLYGSHGYVYFVASPLTDIDNERGRVSLIMELDQQKQFRLAKVEIFGPDAMIEKILASTFKPGEVFNGQLIKNFLAENKSSLPPDVSFEDIELHRDINRGTVDIRFNFQTCEQLRQ